jgi:hypothetical protein
MAWYEGVDIPEIRYRRYQAAVVKQILRKTGLVELERAIKQEQKRLTGRFRLAFLPFEKITSFPVPLPTLKLPWRDFSSISDLLKCFPHNRIMSEFDALFDYWRGPMALVFYTQPVKFMVLHNVVLHRPSCRNSASPRSTARSLDAAAHLLIPGPNDTWLIFETLDAFLESIGPSETWRDVRTSLNRRSRHGNFR